MMKDYGEFIEIIRKIPESEWIKQYKLHGGGEARNNCKEGQLGNMQQCNSDGLKRRHQPTGFDFGNYFDSGDLCKQCKVKTVNTNVQDIYAVDCLP